MTELSDFVAREGLKDWGETPTDRILESASTWLGEQYHEVAPGVFRNDAGRQVRMTSHDLRDTYTRPHVHLEDRGGKDSYHLVLSDYKA